MKKRILIGCSIALFLTLMMPVVHPLEYQTMTQAREAYVQEIIDNDFESNVKTTLLNKGSLLSSSLFLKILKIKWILFLIFKLAMLPFQLFIQKTAKKVASPLKIILAPFWIPARLLLYTIRFLTTPIRMKLLQILQPIIILAKLISIPFKIFDMILFILFPFRHPPIDD